MSLRKTAEVLCVLLFLSAGQAALADDSREQLVAEYAQALGFQELLASQQAELSAYYSNSIDAAMPRFRQMGVSEAGLAEIEEEYKTQMQKIATAWKPEEAARIFMETASHDMSDDDLKAAVAFLNSPEGKKTNASIRAAGAAMRSYIRQQTQSAYQGAIDHVLVRVREIAEHERAQRLARPRDSSQP